MKFTVFGVLLKYYSHDVNEFQPHDKPMENVSFPLIFFFIVYRIKWELRYNKTWQNNVVVTNI